MIIRPIYNKGFDGGVYDGKGFIVLTDDGIEYTDCLTGDEDEVYRRSTKYEDFMHKRLVDLYSRVSAT